MHNPKPPKQFFQISKQQYQYQHQWLFCTTPNRQSTFSKLQNHNININVNASFAHPQTAKAIFPNFKIVRELIQDSEAWGTEVSFMSGEPGTGAGGTGLPERGRLEICPGNRLPGPPEPISYLDCKNPKASLVGEKY